MVDDGNGCCDLDIGKFLKGSGNIRIGLREN